MTANANLTAGTDEARAVVAEALGRHPGLTARKLAGQENLSLPVVTEVLKHMEAVGTATRTPGPTNGNRKSADVWEPVIPTGDTTDTMPDTTDQPTPADEPTPACRDATADEPTTAEDTPGTADATPDTADGDATADEPTLPEAPVSAVPVSGVPVSGAPVGPRQPDLKVLIMAGVLGGHPDGITADEAINESGLSVAMGDRVLAAMEVAGAARRLPVGEDGEELWVIADGDLATVDPANAPTHTTCPTCGHTRKIRRPSVRRATGTGRTTGEINGDGSAKLGKNELRNRVEAFMRDLGPGHDVTPGTVAREIGGRSPGAVGNGMRKMATAGVLVLTREAPETYALADDAPAPTAEVRAFLTPPQTPAAPTGDDTATGDEARTDEAAAAPVAV
ncbi:MarR family transcriptional regulator [Micromonospora sp. D93]|uniref:MarR family transcriptional regulator n=1 Tax=Micromonospora sp. D93 TaxID=2824886 RepID=UPI001FFC9AF9|nr:MarR family transcriptional regulator [Micromonospora sp. D93]